MKTLPTAPLGELAEFVNGYAFKPSDWDGQGLPIIHIQNLNDPNKTYNRTTSKVAEKYRVSPGDLLVSWSASLGVFTWGRDECAYVNQHIFKVIPKPAVVCSDFLRHSLATAIEKMQRHLHGATMKHVNRREFLGTEVYLPPLPEQKRIAGILDKADTIRRKRRAAIDELNTLIPALFYDMFGDPVTNSSGFNYKPLGKLCDVRDGTHDSPQYVREGFPLVTSKNVRNGVLDFADVGLISKKDFDQINKRSKVDEGDIIMPMIGTIGNPILVKTNRPFAIKNVALIKFTENSPPAQFILCLLQNDYFDHCIKKTNRGGTQKFIALKDIRAIPVPQPPIDLQHDFARKVESIQKMQDRYRQAADESDDLFHSLVQRAFKGEL